MKVSAFLGAAALASTAVTAFPFMQDLESRSEEEKRSILSTALNTFMGNSQVKGTSFGGLLNQLKDFSAWSPEQIGNLVEDVQVGFGNVTSMMTNEGRGLPSGLMGILGQSASSLLGGNQDGQPIVDALGLNQAWPEFPPPGGLLDDLIWGGPSQDGEHCYIRPDNYWKVRGPCPGLNTAANHGFLPRDGIILPQHLIIGTWKALSVSPDVSALLTVLMFLFHGDPLTLTLSISFQKDGIDVSGRHRGGTGIGDHGILEGDASVTRNDAGASEKWYGKENADWWSLNETLYQNFLDETGTGVTLVSLSKGRKRAWQIGRDHNPYFDFNPWRMIVAYGESGFTYQALRGASNHFTPEMLEYWFKREQFPPGWRRRFIPVSIPELLAWGAIVEILNPTIPGWNLGMRSGGLFGLKLPSWLAGSSDDKGYLFTTDVFSILGSILPILNSPGKSILQIGCAPVKVFTSLVPTWLVGGSFTGPGSDRGLISIFNKMGDLNGFSC